MGQTLTHGVYLPDEGERNCYNGLAANWQILDNSVGTIAAHTAALAGKAPLVHTHGNITNDGKVGTTANKPLITGTGGVVQAGSFGTAANTFCEGNDSRLSDARTPVAHTHTKSDVTDLFNSANTWSDSQTFLTNPIIRNDTIEKGVTPATNSEKTVVFTDKNNNQISSLYARINANGESYVALRAENLYKNGTMDSTGGLVYSVLFIGMDLQGNPYCVPRADLYPDNTNRFNLGTSSKKWKTLNGINPGALSLPSGGTTENTDWYNVAGDIIPTGGNATDFTGNQNFFTPSKDGWLCLVVKNCSYISVWDSSNRMGQSLYVPDTTKNQQMLLPVLANHSLEIRVIGSSWYSARLFMPKGNI